MRRWRLGRMCRRFAIAAVAFFAGALSVCAETHFALIVGVNEYRNLGEYAALKGPANDAAALAAFLIGSPHLNFRRENIRVLANGPIVADGPPEAARIMAELDQLAESVSPGDLVYLHFGGHGTRQKARRIASEPDGLDEVFLPSDTLEKANEIYPNALVDDDISQKIDAIRAAGAFVFAVFDSCHSSSATRAALGAGSEIVERWLPDAAGASVFVSDEPRREPAIALTEFGSRDGWGGLVTFFAAQTVERTPEMPLPLRTDGAEWRGLFTYMLLDVLAKKPAITYRQLGEGILHAYAAANFASPVPLFEGDLDRTVFGQDKTPPLLQWPMEVVETGVRLPAGTLHGIAKDAILAILPSPFSSTEDAIGYIEVNRADPLTASAYPVEHAGLPALKLKAIPLHAIARPLEIPITFQLAIGLEAVGKGTENASAVAQAAIERIAADDQLPINIDLGPGGALKLLVGSGATLYPDHSRDETARLWFLPPDGHVSSDPRMKPHSIGLDGGLTEERLKQLKENLAAVFRATSLSRLADWSTLRSGQLEAEFILHRKSGGEPISLSASQVPVVAPGDEIHVKLENRTAYPFDVDVLLIGPDYSIQHMMGNRFQGREKLQTPIIGIGPGNFGVRRILLVVREVRPHTPHSDLSYLSQLGVQTRGNAAEGPRDFDELISDLASAPARRSAVPYNKKAASKGSLTTFMVESAPPN